MFRCISICTISLILLFLSCNDCQKENQAMLAKEQELITRENIWSQKQSEYESLLKFKDSIQSLTDSLTVLKWPDSLAGKWNTKIICTDSNCNDYVIGDQKVNVWILTNDSIGLQANELNGSDELIRTYTVNYTKNMINLLYQTDSLAKKQVQIRINLDNLKANKITGKRILTVDNYCTAVYNVELTRPNAKTLIPN